MQQLLRILEELAEDAQILFERGELKRVIDYLDQIQYTAEEAREELE